MRIVVRRAREIIRCDDDDDDEKDENAAAFFAYAIALPDGIDDEIDENHDDDVQSPMKRCFGVVFRWDDDAIAAYDGRLDDDGRRRRCEGRIVIMVANMERRNTRPR